MRTDGKTELQHYVPRLLLRRHAVDPTASKGSERVWCYDKSTDKVFQPNIKGIASGKGFYELERDEGTWSLEASLTDLETKVSPILERINTKRALSGITKEDRFTLSAFLAVQFVRTQAARDYIQTLNRTVLSELIAKGIGPDQFEGMRELSDDEIKEMFLQTLSDAPANFAPHFFSKHWYLTSSRTNDPFYLGDHPVVLENPFNKSSYGAMGLASPGICIYLPLSPTLCLGLLDRAVLMQVRERRDLAVKTSKKVIKRLDRLSRVTKAVEHARALENISSDRRKMDAHILPMINGLPTPYDSQVVMRINSLQVIYAGRWVMRWSPFVGQESG